MPVVPDAFPRTRRRAGAPTGGHFAAEVRDQADVPLDLAAWLVGLSGDERVRLARGPDASPDVLTALSTDPNWRVREGCATNPNTRHKDLVLLSGDLNRWVRGQCARNPATPASVITVLFKDVDPRVRAAAHRRQHT